MKDNLLKLGRKVWEVIVYLIVGEVLKFIWELICFKFFEFVQYRNLKRFSHHSVIEDSGGISEFGNFDGESFSSKKVKSLLQDYWSMKQISVKGQEYLRVELIMRKKRWRFKKSRHVK
jgi:hypothetical protein